MEKKWEHNGTVHQLFIYSEKAYDSMRREVLINILIEFCIPMKPAGLIRMCLKEPYIEVRIGNGLSDAFFIKNGLKQGHALCSMLFSFAL
jgi:hypothetical protein